MPARLRRNSSRKTDSAAWSDLCEYRDDGLPHEADSCAPWQMIEQGTRPGISPVLVLDWLGTGEAEVSTRQASPRMYFPVVDEDDLFGSAGH